MGDLVMGDGGRRDDGWHLGKAAFAQRLLAELCGAALKPRLCRVPGAPRLNLSTPCIALPVALASIQGLRQDSSHKAPYPHQPEA
jgi:hypothetical protein